MSSKLTLSVDGRVAERAKRFARQRGTSVSRLVEDYLTVVSGNSERAEAPPILGRLQGSLKGVDPAQYRRHLKKKRR